MKKGTMGGHKKWNRLEEAEDILDQCFELLSQIPLSDLRKEHMWVPSRDMIERVAETRDRVYRYMLRNKTNGWANEHH